MVQLLLGGLGMEKPQYKIIEIFASGERMRVVYRNEEQAERANAFNKGVHKLPFASVFYCSAEVPSGDYLGALKQFTDWIHTRGGEVVTDFTMDNCP